MVKAELTFKISIASPKQIMVVNVTLVLIMHIHHMFENLRGDEFDILLRSIQFWEALWALISSILKNSSFLLFT